MTFFYLEELGVDEIVTITGLGESNVKVKLHRSRKKLLSILQDHLKEETWTLHAD
jgi:RNA polymerase sigma-70 factor (ECF subfamily)